MIAGKEKGKKGTILQVLREKNRVLVEGLNMRKRHQKARRSDAKGQVVEFPNSMHASNVMLVDPKSGKATRSGKKLVGGKSVRVSKKSQQEI